MLTIFNGHGTGFYTCFLLKSNHLINYMLSAWHQKIRGRSMLTDTKLRNLKPKGKLYKVNN